VRTVLAKSTLPNAAGTSLHFKLLRVEMGPGQVGSAAEADGMVYVLSADPLTVVTGERRILLAPGDALFLPARSGATFEAVKGRTAAFLHVLLGPLDALDHARDGGPATVTELYRTSEPLSGLGAGALAFDITRVTFPPHMPANPPHHRSGDALYFVLSGKGEFTAGGKTVPRESGTPHYEASGFVHQWANPSDSPLVLLVTNVTREGTPAIVLEAPGLPR
jgi:mannose-6-phosphate isomerase-like protein (cupin superfamily)